MKLLLISLVLGFSSVGFARDNTVYPARQYRCNDLNHVLYSQGYVRVSENRRVYVPYAWEARPRCVSPSGKRTAWFEFTIRTASGVCDLGVICREINNGGGGHRPNPPCHAIGCDYPGKPNNDD